MLRPGRRGLCLQMVDAGGRSAAEGWKRMEAPPEGADLVPLDRYDAARAKIAANLQWICAKAYGLGGRARRGPGSGDGITGGRTGNESGSGMVVERSRRGTHWFRMRSGDVGRVWEPGNGTRGKDSYGERPGMRPEGSEKGTDVPGDETREDRTLDGRGRLGPEGI